MPAGAILAAGFVVYLAEAPRAWVVVARPFLGVEAELGLCDDVQVLVRLAPDRELRRELQARGNHVRLLAHFDEALGAEEVVLLAWRRGWWARGVTGTISAVRGQGGTSRSGSCRVHIHVLLTAAGAGDAGFGRTWFVPRGRAAVRVGTCRLV